MFPKVVYTILIGFLDLLQVLRVQQNNPKECCLGANNSYRNSLELQLAAEAIIHEDQDGSLSNTLEAFNVKRKRKKQLALQGKRPWQHLVLKRTITTG